MLTLKIVMAHRELEAIIFMNLHSPEAQTCKLMDIGGDPRSIRITPTCLTYIGIATTCTSIGDLGCAIVDDTSCGDRSCGTLRTVRR